MDLKKLMCFVLRINLILLHRLMMQLMTINNYLTHYFLMLLYHTLINRLLYYLMYLLMAYLLILYFVLFLMLYLSYLMTHQHKFLKGKLINQLLYCLKHHCFNPSLLLRYCAHYFILWFDCLSFVCGLCCAVLQLYTPHLTVCRSQLSLDHRVTTFRP